MPNLRETLFNSVFKSFLFNRSDISGINFVSLCCSLSFILGQMICNGLGSYVYQALVISFKNSKLPLTLYLIQPPGHLIVLKDHNEFLYHFILEGL